MARLLPGRRQDHWATSPSTASRRAAILCISRFSATWTAHADEFFAEVARHAPEGLRALFSCCIGFGPDADLARLDARAQRLRRRRLRQLAGRTVRQVREEAALHEALATHIRETASTAATLAPREVHRDAAALPSSRPTSAGRLPLSPEAATPLGFNSRNLLHLVRCRYCCCWSTPLLISSRSSPSSALRRLEKSRSGALHRAPIGRTPPSSPRLEDHDVTNQFSAMGSLKPGLVRRWISRFVLWSSTTRPARLHARAPGARAHDPLRALGVPRRPPAHRLPQQLRRQPRELHGRLHQQGRLRAQPRLQQRHRLPADQLAGLDGCADERKFKEYLRRHQLPTQVWYKAYPGLTAVDLERNARIRQGLESIARRATESPRMGRALMSQQTSTTRTFRACVRFGFGRAHRGLLRAAAGEEARRGACVAAPAPVTTAVTMQPPPTTAMQVAFTAAGLESARCARAVRAGLRSRVPLGHDGREPLSAARGRGSQRAVALGMGRPHRRAAPRASCSSPHPAGSRLRA